MSEGCSSSSWCGGGCVAVSGCPSKIPCGIAAAEKGSPSETPRCCSIDGRFDCCCGRCDCCGRCCCCLGWYWVICKGGGCRGDGDDDGAALGMFFGCRGCRGCCCGCCSRGACCCSGSWGAYDENAVWRVAACGCQDAAAVVLVCHSQKDPPVKTATRKEETKNDTLA